LGIEMSSQLIQPIVKPFLPPIAVVTPESKEKAELLKVLSDLAGRLEHELNAVITFWTTHSLDTEHTGYVTSVDYDGTIYDTTKHCLLQAQQAYMLAKLYNTSSPHKTEDILEAARLGGEFLLRHVHRASDNRCYNEVTREGKPLEMGSDIQVECMVTMALYELHVATKQANYLSKAEVLLRAVLCWAKDMSQVNEHRLGPTYSNLSVLVDILRVLIAMGSSKEKLRQYKEDFTWCIKSILLHVQKDNMVVLDTVTKQGAEVMGSKGRLVNPGIVMEAGWLLLTYAQLTNKKELKKQAQELFIEKTYETAWDPENGGIFTFLDCDGLSPVQLEWSMKLWWPVCEAMISLIMAYRHTGERKFLNNFSRVFDYAMIHFREPNHGEWYGYSDREGRVTHTFKGGPDKGCFHIPRCLHMCAKLVREIVAAGGVEP